MVKNPSPGASGAAGLRRLPPGHRPREHGRKRRFRGTNRAVNNARARLIALWPCDNMRTSMRGMVNKAFPPRF
jgi:hypothetical protein